MANGLFEGKRQVEDLRKALGGKRVRLADPALDPLFAELELLAGGAAATEWYSVVPREALDWIDGYVPQLAGVLETDVLKRVRDVVAGAMLEGKTTEGTMAALKAAHVQVDAFARHRVEAIARTESVRAYNLGHLIALKGTEGVAGVEFTAILDDRTSNACQAREGLRLRIDDPRLASNTPPLHPNCRSALIPILDLEVPEGWKGDPGKADALAVSDPTVQRPEDIDAVRKVLGAQPVSNAPTVNVGLPFIKDPTNRKWAEDVMKDAPDEIKRIVNSLNPPPEYKEIKGTSYADVYGKGVAIGKYARTDESQFKNTFFHEIGHLVDARNATPGAKRHNGSKAAFHWSIEQNSELAKAILKDIKVFRGTWGDLPPEKVAKIREITIVIDRYSKWYSDYGVGGVVDSISEGQYRAYWGHSKSYWKTGYRNTEVFANLFSVKAQGKNEAMEVLRGLFPNTVEAFEKFIASIGS